MGKLIILGRQLPDVYLWPAMTALPRISMGAAVMSLAKTLSATKNGAILGREGVNTISIASTEY
jgi:hypothetical protein